MTKKDDDDFIKQFYDWIDLGDVGDGTKSLYKRQIKKLINELPENQKNLKAFQNTGFISRIISGIYSNDESKKTIFKAVALSLTVSKMFDQKIIAKYNKILDVLKKEIQKKKGDNVVIDPSKWMTLEELENVPNLVEKDIVEKFGKLFITEKKYEKLSKAEQREYQKKLMKWAIVYFNVFHTLRLDHFNVPLTKMDPDENYIIRKKKSLVFYLNKFKNVRSMGPQVIKYNDEKIMKYLNQFKIMYDKEPTHLLYKIVQGKEGASLFTSKKKYGEHIQDIFKEYTGKPTDNSTIRHIRETYLIQDPKYQRMTNNEKDEAHRKLLHSTFTAQDAYNKILPKSGVKICECCGQVIP